MPGATEEAAKAAAVGPGRIAAAGRSPEVPEARTGIGGKIEIQEVRIGTAGRPAGA